ncbi:MAG: hypothetical protein WDN03_06995 [Rhizomicrobium sp.]
MLELAVPDEMPAGEHIFDEQRAAVRQSPFPERNLEIAFLRPVRIEADRDEDARCLAGDLLAVVEDVRIEGIVELDAQMRLQRRLGLAQRLSVAISATMLPGAFQSRGLISYFSESRYSSRPGKAAASQSSKPNRRPIAPTAWRPARRG